MLSMAREPQFSMSSRAAASRAGVRTRRIREIRHGREPPRSTEEVEAEREARGVPTLASQRLGLARPQKLRAGATHVDADTGLPWTCVSGADENVFGVRCMRRCPYARGQAVNVRNLASMQLVRGTVAEVEQRTSTMYIIAIN